MQGMHPRVSVPQSAVGASFKSIMSQISNSSMLEFEVIAIDQLNIHVLNYIFNGNILLIPLLARYPSVAFVSGFVNSFKTHHYKPPASHNPNSMPI